MSNQKPEFLNFQVDHMTMLMQPEMYNVTYVLFRTIFGVTPEDLIYEKRKAWNPGEEEKSMTFAVSVGEVKKDDKIATKTIIALVQPTEPESQSSHVRSMLNNHSAASHWQHIALRTPDLLSFHEHAVSLGVNFVTPILKDGDEDVIQAFSGEWFYPGSPSSALFFEFLQRNPTDSLMKKIEEQNRETWFRDETFLGLYGEKEKEYQKNEVVPFIDHALFEKLSKKVAHKPLWEINSTDIEECETIMRAYAKEKHQK